ncbi:unnamed protein product [Chrysodeixis includens]|uniref:DNA primase large subunit C-terminal domain-containing protein n=1 Tax=Chrysodeixis includens TaxID=689277 RepID=A0A9P0FPS6_CHRIL|nr:unnamed protein product [Chrysodeixis includens]
MAFFYLTPVKGELPAHLLDVIVDNRLGYLKTVLNEEPPLYNEYLVEGSMYDNVGHFTLCIISILCENREFSQLFVNAELELFKRRLETLTAYELRSFSKKLLRIIRKTENIPIFIDSLQVLCQHLVLKDVAQHICTSHKNHCNLHSIKLHFKQCLSLVAKRQVELTNGFAIIPCGRWKQYMTMLFKENLIRKIKYTDVTSLKSDPRIMELLYKVKKEFSLSKDSTNILLSKDVDVTSTFFPPCMLNLHQNLRRRHRLTHSQRFYYSLFLKDIGMPVEEAVDFWKAEYSLHPNGHHACCHNWEKDEKKYLYGIRHMYGLEGGRKNYSSVNCQRIQSIDNCSEGGCPFKAFDSNNMVPLLKNCTDEILSQINELKQKRLYTNACMLFMNSTYSKTMDCDNFSFNFTPVKYYKVATDEEKMEL